MLTDLKNGKQIWLSNVLDIKDNFFRESVACLKRLMIFDWYSEVNRAFLYSDFQNYTHIFEHFSGITGIKY